ncbi:membrane-bound acid phosphatase, putative [Leishmania panamensis]|uniref:Membrane-bound acid phosphatase, putative n=3 Tax=Leishmania panamensis TaxID=5679 RepID=A0A088RV55_LEIPA|nr:membrane-bound acid phosphatase, putative [Leishmania panamensis]AIN99913.1 membrane-bound acid phosphatase, putative [Leishmania panamensis]
MPAVLRSPLPRSVRRMAVLAAATALLAAVCLPAPARGSVEWVLQQVQVLHRHGSRSAVPSYNATDICGSTPCGELNPEGETMVRNVGEFLRARYTADATVVDAPFLPSSDYDLSVVASRSTDVRRTLQSAQLLLAGMFPNAIRLIPAIHTVPTSQDTMLYTFSQPWVALYATYATAAQQARTNPVVDHYFPDWTELRGLAAEVWSEGYCSNYETRLNCAIMLFDIAAAKRSVGKLPAAVAARYDDLHAIIAEWFRGMWHYDASNPFLVQQGGRGQPFLQQVLTNMDDFIAARSTYKVMHYSGHDISLAAVWGTLGDRSAYAMQPTYAQTFVLELLKSATTGEYGVRVLRGWPGQTPDTGFTFSWDPTWQLRCRGRDETNYAATDNLCPLEDFRRYVTWTVGTDPRGMCLLDVATSAVLNCPTAEAEQTVGVALSESCSLYRAVCPQYACAPGYVLSASESRCTCASAACLVSRGSEGKANVSVTVSMPGVSRGTAAGIAMATFSAGALLAVLMTLIALVLLRCSGGSARYSGPCGKCVARGEPTREAI